MLATLVIGLREGLEASLIVGIIAAFLRRTGKPLRPMWIGVGIAIALSIAVGVILQLVSASLPQAAQEGMESVIGFVAVAIVTGMIGWMNVHARNMRSDLEQHAAEALRDGTAWALVGMAFLAVLKEGFETAVFVLAAFQSSTSVLAAGAGAIIGVAIAVAIGIGIFRGGVRLNLGRFFTITGIFLVFVAAGLVLSSLRTAHEAGWILIGQQRTVDLNWLAPAGSVQAALFTGVLGIPADPRLIEVLGWLAYLVPTLLYLAWPAKRRPKGRSLGIFRVALAGALVVVGLVLAVAVALPTASASHDIALVGSADKSGTAKTTGTATIQPQGKKVRYSSTLSSGWDSGTFSLAKLPTVTDDGIPTKLRTIHASGPVTGLPSTLTLTQLIDINGGRLPIGISAANNPGPFTTTWATNSTTKLWLAGGGLVDATSAPVTIATLSGGGLDGPRTLTPPGVQSTSWHATAAARDAAVTGITRAITDRSELLLWKLWLPIVLALTALVLLGYALRSRLRRPSPTSPSPASRSRKTKENFA